LSQDPAQFTSQLEHRFSSNRRELIATAKRRYKGPCLATNSAKVM
jgi:hypothetical protein